MNAPTALPLSYPFGSDGPAAGVVRAIAEGLDWVRIAVPGPLRHVNCWLFADDAGVAMVDTGMNTPDARADWTAVLSGACAGQKIARVIGTHFHPDHVGLAGWLCARDDAALWMTRGEWLTARVIDLGARGESSSAHRDFLRLAGAGDEQLDGVGRVDKLFDQLFHPLPYGYRRIVDGEVLAIGRRQWRVVVGSGHSPEHACLLDEAAGILIAGDQVLPRISSNISLTPMEPDADPLGEWLRSIAKMKTLPADLLVLPGHGEPFTGLHHRLDALAAEHHHRLDALEIRLARPSRAIDCFATLFARPIDAMMLGMAAGEAMAHLRHLEIEGRARRETIDGVAWWSRT